MARKNYSEEFRRQAVDLVESTPGATVKSLAEDLGVSRGTLATWVRNLGTQTLTPAHTPTPSPPRTESTTARIARLEAENAQLRADAMKNDTEKKILRQAAKYFAGETNW